MIRKEIYNCLPGDEKEGQIHIHLLTRYTLLKTPWGQLRLHVFHHDDYGRELHDHPWHFVSLILWGGYWEVAPSAECFDPSCDGIAPCEVAHRTERVWRKPGSILFRPPLWRHRVELARYPGGYDIIDGRPFRQKLIRKAVTLIWMSKKVREWGFYSDEGWIQWEKYHKAKGCL